MTRLKVPEFATVPDTLDLVTFCRVVDLGSMTAAGRVLGESKATVSRRLSRLEAQLGTALLRRDGRSVAPTEEGLLYREKVGVALDVLDGAAGLLRAGHEAPSGLLRVTAPPGVAGSLLRQVLPGFLAAWPDIRVELLLTEAVLSFREHRVDVAFRLSLGLPDSSLIAHRLEAVTAQLVASPAYLARRGTPATPDDLLQHDFLTAPIDDARTLTLAPRSGGPPVTVHLPGRVLSHDLALLHQLAVDGAGITMVPSVAARTDLLQERLVPVLPDWDLRLRVHLYLIHAGGLLQSKVRVFRDHVLASLAGLCPR